MTPKSIQNLLFSNFCLKRGLSLLVLSIARFWSIENSEYKIVGPCAHFGLLGVHQEYHTQVGQHVMFILLKDLDKSLLINK